MPDIYMDVDVALAEVPVNLLPLIDDTDFKTIESALVYNQAGLVLVWNFITTAGAQTQTGVTPTTAGVYDWVSQGNGIYTVEIPASAGASINNDTEGHGWFSGVATGVLPWKGPVICFRAAGLNDLLIDSAYSVTRGLAGTALPAAAADAALGLPISDAGGLDLDSKLANTNEITVARMGALTDWLNGGRLDLLLDAIPTTAMRGTDSAATEAKQDIIDTNVDSILVDTGTTLDALIKDVPTVAEFEARSLVSADYIVVGDTIAGVTLCTTTTTNTDMVGTNGANTVEPDPAGTAATPTEVATALTDIHLDHLLAANYDPAAKPGVATALLNELIENDSGVSRYTVNSLENAPSGTGASAEAIVNEWEVQSQADPTGFHVNVKEVDGTAQTANDNSADINLILGDTDELQTNQGDWATATSVTVSDKTGFSLSTAGIAAIWNALTSGMTTVGSLGKKLADWVVGTIDTYTGNTKQTADHTSAIATAQSDLDTITGADGVTLATLQALYAPNKVVPDVAGTAATPADVDQSLTDLLATAIDGTVTIQHALMIFLSALAGKSDGAQTALQHFRDPADLKNRITSVVDSSGNRTSITLDLT